MKTEGMHVVRARAAGLDVHKLEIAATVLLCEGEPVLETRRARVPDRVLPLPGPETGGGGISQPLAFSVRHGSVPEHRANDLGGLYHHDVAEMGVLGRRPRAGVADQRRTAGVHPRPTLPVGDFP